ncbi:MAG: hypothetical protein CMJ83_18910, partial [Planctomycetes bacterium]|nr:hypothetical protein [Planctomycetota bacterium]
MDDDLIQPSPSVKRVFLERYLSDRQKGLERSLEDYVAQFPAFRETIELAWSELHPSSGSGSEPEDEGGFGRFEIQKQIGRGGQGVVFRAVDTRLKRTVALKVLDRMGRQSPEQLERFRREAMLAARIEHPG